MQSIRSLLIAMLCLCAAPAAAQQRFETQNGSVLVERMSGPFKQPWSLAFLPSEPDQPRYLVTERAGKLLLVHGDKAQEVIGAPKVSSRGEGGLLDVALAHDFAQSGVIYLTFSELGRLRAARTAVASARLNLTPAPQLEDFKVIFRQELAVKSGLHFGSRIVVNPDGTLFVTLGDRARRSGAQDVSTYLGKVAHITPDGAAAETSKIEGAKAEIHSYGHSNPLGAALDPQTGALWTVESAETGGDELNLTQKGLNYGWPEITQGKYYSGEEIGSGSSAPGMEQPAHYWDAPLPLAPSGLTFYSGELLPEWRGNAFVSMLKGQLITRLELENGKVSTEEHLFKGVFGRIRDVREGPAGGIWFISDGHNGDIFRITPAQN